MPEDNVTISRAELSALIAEQVKVGIAAANGGNSRVLRTITERKVEVRMIENRVVVGFANRGSLQRPVYIYEVRNPSDPMGAKISMVDLILEGMTKEDKPITIDLKQFREESSRVKVTVVSRNDKEWIVNQGTVRKTEYENYSAAELDYEIPVDNVGIVTMYTVAIPEEYGGAREVKVHQNYINM